MIIEIRDDCVKYRQGKYVVYDVDWLLSNLAGEVALLWDSRKINVKNFNREEILKSGSEEKE
jgi:hypothetical protein